MYRLVNMGLKISHSVSSWLCVLSHFILRLQKKMSPSESISRWKFNRLSVKLFHQKISIRWLEEKEKVSARQLFFCCKKKFIFFYVCRQTLPSFLFCYSHLWKKFDWIAKQWVLAAGRTMENHHLLGDSSVAGGKARSFDGCLKSFCMIPTR